MPLTERPVIDQWSPLSHKHPISDGVRQFPNTLAPTWVPANHRRRLDAYTVLAAYMTNVARLFLPGVYEGEQSTGLIRNEQSEHREYGDADLLVDRVMAGVLGDAVEIVVDGADEDLPDEPQIPPQPQDLDPDATDIEKRVFAVRKARWTDQAGRIVDEWERDVTAQPALQERQDWLRDWADSEQLPAKLVEGERDTIGLGDGVYVLSWSSIEKRALLSIYDPGFYFPVLDDNTRDFPRKVHLAWEYVDHEGRRFVRRLTWELAPIGRDADGNQLPPAAQVDVPTETTWPDGAATRVNTVGQFVRNYPWNVDDDGKPIESTITCYFTDATWAFGELDGRHVNDFIEADAVFAITDDGNVARRLDLRIDFLPVVHVPNTPAHREHFGKSALAMIAQVLDDVAASDTDIQAASALAAGPVIGISGDATLPSSATMVAQGMQVKAPATLEVRPGVVYQLGANGRMDVLDLSQGLTTLLAVNKDLRHTLSVNARVPGEILGRVPASAAVSGVALALSFGPFNQLVQMLRLTRETKHSLILKFAQRLAQAGGVLAAGANPPSRIEYGSYLPADRTALITQVTQMLEAHAISHQTAVALLVAGGLTIEDAHNEVDRIRADNPSAARDVADATGSEQLAADWLGLDLPGTGVTPPRKPGEKPAPQPAGDTVPPGPVLPPTPPAPAP